jgi:basic membrane protein A and related proteins
VLARAPEPSRRGLHGVEPTQAAGLGTAPRPVYRRPITRAIALAVVAAAAIFAVAGAASGGTRQVRIGLVLEQTLVGRASDPFQYGAFRGLVRAKRNLHVQAKAVAPSPTGVGDQFVAPFNRLAREHYDLVIGVGFLELQAASRAARKFPHEKFAILDATHEDVPRHPANLEGTVFHTEQAAYLAGVLAARMADRGPRPHVVSSVGGLEIPTVDSFIAGFEAGAKHADPKIKLLRTYTGTFLAKRPCANAARAQIDRGSTVVFDVAGACGLGALATAKREGAYGIGVDTDQSYLGRFILTSVIKNLDVAVYDLAKRVIHHRLPTGGNLNFDLRDNGVGLGRFSPVVRLSVRRELTSLARQIRQGKVKVPTQVTP